VQWLGEEDRTSRGGPPSSSPPFGVHSRPWRQTLNRSRRQVQHAGEQLLGESCGPTVPSMEGPTGAGRPAQIFVAVLGAAHDPYAEATGTQSLPAGLAAHVRAVTFFGGVPQLVVPDPLNAGVAQACRYDPDLHPPYAAWARHYQLAV
jgi:transposase